MKEAHDHHRVSPEGKAMGANLSRLADAEWRALAATGEDDWDGAEWLCANSVGRTKSRARRRPILVPRAPRQARQP